MNGQHYSLADGAITAQWAIAARRLSQLSIKDRLHGTIEHFPAPFSILLKDGTVYGANNLHVDGPTQRKVLKSKPGASRYSDRIAGEEFDVPLVSQNGSFHVVWAIVLRDGSNYIREALTLRAGTQDISVKRVQLLDAELTDAHVVGSVKGSPIVEKNFFLGFEHPLSSSNVTNHRATAYVDRELPLRAQQSITYSLVVGVARTG